MAGLGVVNWVYLPAGGLETVGIGDLVSADAGGLPIYRVLAIKDGQLWLQDEEPRIVRIARRADFPWKVRTA